MNLSTRFVYEKGSKVKRYHLPENILLTGVHHSQGLLQRIYIFTLRLTSNLGD